MNHVTVVGGGLGTAKLLVGLVEALSDEQVHVVANVGDDDRVWGLHLSPDIDGILYALSGELDPSRDWNRRGESFQCQGTARKLGMKSRIRISDCDLATHLLRTGLMGSGKDLDATTQALADRFGIGVTLIASTSDVVRTVVETSAGDRSVAECYADDSLNVSGVRYDGAESAVASPRAIASILGASRVVLAPADPVRSLDAILAVPGMRDALRRTSAGKIAVSPVVGSLPAVGRGSGLGRLMRVTGSGEVSARGVALRYREFLDCIVIHTTDLPSLDGIRETGLDVWVENIVMTSADDATRLAKRVGNDERSFKRGA